LLFKNKGFSGKLAPVLFNLTELTTLTGGPGLSGQERMALEVLSQGRDVWNVEERRRATGMAQLGGTRPSPMSHFTSASAIEERGLRPQGLRRWAVKIEVLNKYLTGISNFHSILVFTAAKAGIELL
jgi:hypothetical protein